MSKDYCVYVHTNKINGKKYVGQTCQAPERRWGKNGSGYTECPHFWNAIQKYGWDSFEHEIVKDGMSHEEACAFEIDLIAKLNTNNPDFGYNVSKGGDGIDPEVTKTLWQREGFKEFASGRMKEAWQDPVKRKNRSEQATKRWQNEDFRRKVTKSIENTCRSAVQCIETGKVYETIRDAERELGVNHANICRSIRTGYRCGGYHWKYYDDPV